ncbi:MAG TPA: hypothetical protein VHF90_09250 [Thermoleophilaceae bacterium]|nr:hypothetical protein [Thermoleophilaceae bacterium]
MSATTIQVPADHVDPIRQILIARRRDAERPGEIDGLLDQLAPRTSDAGPPCELSGDRTLLWSAVYDALCVAAEQLADDCNEYWRGDVTAGAIQAAIARVSSRLELLTGLGAPPG